MKFRSTTCLGAMTLMLATTFNAGSATADAPLETRIERLCERIEAGRKEFHLPGVAIAVVKGDQVVLAKGFGMADVERERPVTPETLFAIGSTTKAFTATAIGMLVDDGKMKWDDPVSKHLPYYDISPDDESNEAVTIRDLLCHRSGFTRMGILWAAGTVSREEMLRKAATAKRWSPFRKKFNYCNVTFVAAGEAAGVASGLGWDELVSRRILKPLGMNDTNTTYAEMKASKTRSLGYQWNEESGVFRSLPLRDLTAVAPSGSINSNVIDMAKWVQFQLAHGMNGKTRLISDQQLDETWSKQISMGNHSAYGLGWMLREINGKRVVEHGGSIDGFGAEVGLFVDDGVGFVMLFNVAASPLRELSLQIVAETMMGEFDADATESSQEEEDLENYTGKYVANFGPFRDARFTVQVKDGKLAVDVPGQTLYELKGPDADGKRSFAITDQVAVSFKQNDAGKAIALTMYQSGMEFELPREGAQLKSEIDLDEAKKYVGSYHVDDRHQARIVVSSGRLTLDLPDQGLMELRPPNQNGEWEFRITPTRAVKFETKDNRVVAMNYIRRDGESKRWKRAEGGAENSLPSLAEVLTLRKSDQRHATFAGLKSLKISRKLRFVHAGVSGETSVICAADDRLHTTLDCGRFGKTTNMIDGSRGWVESNLQPSKMLDDLEIAQVWLESPSVLFGDWRDFFDEIIVQDQRKVSGREMIKIRLVKEPLLPVTVLIDAKSGDLVRSEMRVKTALGVIPIQTQYADHRPANGIRMPWKSTSRNEHIGQLDAEVIDVETDIELSRELFRFPQGN